MTSEFCKDCKFVVWMVGIGQGIRCQHPKLYKPGEEPLPVISSIEDCRMKEKK